ncbi:hypothetical protein KI387_020341, partial [Taxus chinensis]
LRKMELKRLTRCEACVYVIFPGLLAMTALLSGLFLWGLLKKHKSKEKASSSSKVEKASVFPTPSQEKTFFPPDSWNVYVNEAPFDPQTNYAQLLSEAQKFMAQEKDGPPSNPRLSRTLSSKPGQQITPSDNINVLPAEKCKSSWKFWKRSKKISEGNGSISSPPHQARSLKRSVSGPVRSHSGTGRKGHGYYSGPLYSVGMPHEPANYKFSGRSGTRSGSTTPVRGEEIESPYVLLKSCARQTHEPELLYTV